MKFYLIFEKTQPETKMNKPTFVVSDKEVAEAVCKEFQSYYYEEREINADIQTLSNLKLSTLKTPQDEEVSYEGSKYPKCPYCGKSNFIINGSMSTTMYCRTIMKYGEVISKDNNTHTKNYKCLACGRYFKSVNDVIQKDDELMPINLKSYY